MNIGRKKPRMTDKEAVVTVGMLTATSAADVLCEAVGEVERCRSRKMGIVHAAMAFWQRRPHTIVLERQC